MTATGAHISIVGHITTDELRRYLRATELGNGFANRFLWICARRSKLLPDGGSFTGADRDPFVRWLQEAAEFARGVDEVRRDPEARALWHQVYPTLSGDVPGLLGAVTSRAEAQVTRLSLLYALLDCSAVIRKEHLLAALALWEYAQASCRHIFGEATGDPLADEILRALRAAGAGGLTRSDITRDLFKRNQQAERVGQALGVLESAGLARREMKEGTGGRDAEVWRAARVIDTPAT